MRHLLTVIILLAVGCVPDYDFGTKEEAKQRELDNAAGGAGGMGGSNQ